ncbi:glycosyl transferase [Levilactobacillus namurensis]|nr:glycosyl transferase [Levilactobacillus namurensis]
MSVQSIKTFQNIAVVVTFNKLEMLKSNLKRLFSCGNLLTKIVVINNASTDGTTEYLNQYVGKKNIVVINEKKNLGGARGFNIGIKRAMSLSADAVWLMDDDTMPTKSTLEELINARLILENKNIFWGLLASNVRWIDGNSAKMNVPKVKRVWNSLLSRNMVQIESSSFVSMYINAEVIKRVGYPISEFFIWGDDVEYSKRISKSFPSYCVLNSRVQHNMAQNNRVDILTDSPSRISRYYYDVRNKFYISKQDGLKSICKYTLRQIILIFRVLFNGDYKFKKISVIIKGFFAGIFFNPKIEKY